jgi:hypothetical protein
MKNLQVVDHQVEHDIDVQASRRKDCQPVYLHKARLPLDPHEPLNSRIEVLNVANGQDPIARCCYQTISLLQRRGNWLLDQDVDSTLEQIAADLTVIDRRHSHHGSLQTLGKAVEVIEDLSPELIADLFCDGAIRIEDSHQLCGRICSQNSNVVPTQGTGANDADPHRIP